MKKRLLIGGLIVAALIGSVVAVVALRPMPSVTVMQEAPAQVAAEQKDEAEMISAEQPDAETAPVVTPQSTTAEPTSPTPAPQPVVSAGRYEDYSASLVDDAGYSTTILFFYAPWCPECRAYDQAIRAGTMPAGVQILRASYDDEQALRQKHGVTIQSTFVRVNSAGDKQVLWNGYGKSKSLDAIIENTK